jgi:hypothetical protein
MSTSTIQPKGDTEILKPGQVTAQSFSSLWKLFFKRGMNPRAELVFSFKGSKDKAIKRGREFCLKCNFKFIHVEPFLVDLEQTEREFLGER